LNIENNIFLSVEVEVKFLKNNITTIPDVT